MLKPADPGPSPPGRPIGEIFSDLIDHGKAYARAEVSLATAIGAAKARGLAVPMAMFGLAFIAAFAAVAALALGVVMTLARFIGPLAAGFIAMLVFVALAGGIGWFGAERLKRLL